MVANAKSPFEPLSLLTLQFIERLVGYTVGLKLVTHYDMSSYLLDRIGSKSVLVTIQLIE